MALGIAKSILKKAFYGKDGKFSKMSTFNTAFAGWMGLGTYQEAREEGNGVITSGIKAAADTAFSFVAPITYMAVTGIPELGKLGVDAYHGLNQYARQIERQRRNIPFQNATFVDNQQTYTMRQAGMNLARQGQYAAAQSTFGNEAASVAYMGR